MGVVFCFGGGLVEGMASAGLKRGACAVRGEDLAVALERRPQHTRRNAPHHKGTTRRAGPQSEQPASTHTKARARLPSRRTLSSSRLYVMTDRVWEQSAATSTKSLPVIPKVQSMVPGWKGRAASGRGRTRNTRYTSGGGMEGGKKEHGEVQCARSLEVMYIGVRLSVFRGVHCPRARPRRPQTCLFSLCSSISRH